MSSTGGLWIFACLCLSIIREVEGVVTSPPLNTVAKVNGDAIFNCTATPSGPLAWSLTKDGISSGEIRITTGCSVDAGLQSHYRTEQPGGPSTCNLIVFDITMEQAGVYYCVDTAASSLALLTVLDSSPTITYNNTPDVMEGEKVVITCRLNYSGSVEPASTLRPHFYWTDHTGNNVSNAYNPPPSNNSVLSQLTVTAVREDITPYTCHVYLQLIQTIPAYATNTPSVDSIAGSPNITVLYSPSTPAITSRPEVITINDVVCGISVLTCSSTGNPTPNYKWSDSAENVVLTTTNTLTLAEVNRSYKCEAYNTIRNVMRNASATTTVSTDNCTSTAGQRCCVFPRDETTSVTVVGCDNGALCDCSNGTSGIRLICNATTFPNASHMWSGPEIEPIYSPIFDKVTQNGSYGCTAYFNQALSNYTGDVKFSNGTNEENVGQCSNPVSSTASITTILTTTTTPACNHTACPVASTSAIPAIVGAVIGVLVIANILATCLFFWYYKRVEVSHSGKIERNNKLKLDRRFSWLKKMMPCVSDTKESAGSNCLWVSLFILLGIVTGIVTFPIWIILANKYEKNIETSALNRRENGEGNGSGENGRRPVNISSANHSQPPPANQMNAIRREDPYQNESSRENIELNNSLRSRNLLLSDSPPSRAPPAGRPPPPPNKPSINMSTGRSKDYTVNDETPANPEHTTYADLPFVPRNTLPTATPVQFLNVSNDTYAALNKT